LKDLIRLMLVPEEKRLTAKQCLNHPWFKLENSKLSRVSISKMTIEKMTKYSSMDFMRKAIVFSITNRLSYEETMKQREYYSKLLNDVNSYLTYEDFKKNLQSKMSEDMIIKIFQGLDVDQDGKIYLTEFMAGTLSYATLLTESNLRESFNYIDRVSLKKFLNFSRKGRATSCFPTGRGCSERRTSS